MGKAAANKTKQNTRERTYICIDLKTFYASVECAARGLDPFTQNLVVADVSRGRTTICLAISPAMKKLGVRNRCRLFEIPGHIDYIAAKPRMRHYMEVSARIYGIYLEYVSPQDIHVYSIDECFIDATPYLTLYGLTAREFADELRSAVLARTGITATAGIGPNLFLSKVALDVSAKHAADGIGVLDEESFRQTMWTHRPITDIWGIGPGIAARLAAYQVYDLMGVAALDPQILYREFGVTAEYLIDHAHGVEPCTIAEIQAYRPQATSISNGQVLARNYSYNEALTVLREMIENSVLDLVEKCVVTSSISLYIGYGSEIREVKRLDASGSASFTDNCGKRQSSCAEDIEQAIPRPKSAGANTHSSPLHDHSTLEACPASSAHSIPPKDCSSARTCSTSSTHSSSKACPTSSAHSALKLRTANSLQRGSGAHMPSLRDEERDLLKSTVQHGTLFVGEHGKRPVNGYGGYAHANKQRRLGERTNSRKKLLAAFEQLYAECVDPRRPIKRISIGFGDLLPEEFATLDLFTNVEAEARERELMHTIIDVKDKYGKNALLMGRSLRPEATARDRNEQVGGHRA